MTLKQVTEALIFASQKPLSPREIVGALKAAGADAENLPAADLLSTVEAQILTTLTELQSEYEQGGRAFRLVEQASGWRIVTAGDFASWVRQLYPESKPTRLSGPALETLAIIAYRQPITRADIEAVRGVAVDGMVQLLLERGLIRIAGRAEVPGRPLLYESTQFFLDHFGLKTLDELPNSSELRRIHLPAAPVEKPEKSVAPVETSSLETAPIAEVPSVAPEPESSTAPQS
jgi:segregation and condensation protein B